MKRLILASTLCLAFALVLRAQEKIHVLPPVQLIDPAHPFGSVPPPLNPPSRSLSLVATLPPLRSGVCSVPLLDAHVDAYDPGIARMPQAGSVPIRKAKVPAPPCVKK